MVFPYGSDQSHASFPLHGKDDQKVGLVEIEVQLKVGRRAARLHVGNVEEPRIRAPGKADCEGFSYDRMRSVAAREIGRFAGFLGAVRSFEYRAHTLGLLIEPDQLRPALHVDPQFGQPFNQHLPMQTCGKTNAKENGVKRSPIFWNGTRAAFVPFTQRLTPAIFTPRSTTSSAIPTWR